MMMFCPDWCVAHRVLPYREAGVNAGYRPRPHIVPKRPNPDFLVLQERASAIAEALETESLDLVDRIVANTAADC